MVNHNLVGGAITIFKNDGVKVNGKDDIPYMKWNNKIHVPNHQPVMIVNQLNCLMFGEVNSYLEPHKATQDLINLDGNSCLPTHSFLLEGTQGI